MATRKQWSRSERGTTRRASTMPDRIASFAAALAAVSLVFAAARVRAESPTPFTGHFDYLYIDAGEKAGGGHAALRMGSDVFHFQYHDGLLRLRQDRWLDFALSYRGVQNRNVESLRVAVRPDTQLELQKAFRRRVLADSRRFALLEAVRDDVTVARALEARRPVRVAGAGFFESPHASPASSTLAALRDAIATDRGTDALESLRARTRRELRDLDAEPTQVNTSDFAQSGFPRPHYTFSERYRDGLAALAALDVLERGARLDASRLIVLPGLEGALRPQERAALEHALETLRGRLARLARGTRPDWGPAMLLGMARLEAMHHTLRSGRLTLLDALPRDARRISVEGTRPAAVSEAEREAKGQLAQARSEWTRATGWDEPLQAALEQRAARWLELRRARLGSHSIRIAPGSLIPTAPALLLPEFVPDRVATDGSRIAATLSAHARAVDGLARSELGYELLRRNCVSELFTTIDLGLARVSERTASAGDGELEQLGGRLAGDRPDFIPVVSAWRVNRSWRIAERRQLASLRSLRIAAMKRNERPAKVSLRESNTLSATAYAPNDQDSLFLFFTDRAKVLRPLLGLGNLAYGLLGVGVGLVKLPVDRGQLLGRAVRGALFSFPELGFQNIRKGSNDWVGAESRTLLGLSDGKAQ